MNQQLLDQSVRQYSPANAQYVPYLDELIASMDISDAGKQYGDTLIHNMNLSTELPQFLAEFQEKYMV